MVQIGKWPLLYHEEDNWEQWTQVKCLLRMSNLALTTRAIETLVAMLFTHPQPSVSTAHSQPQDDQDEPQRRRRTVNVTSTLLGIVAEFLQEKQVPSWWDQQFNFQLRQCGLRTWQKFASFDSNFWVTWSSLLEAAATYNLVSSIEEKVKKGFWTEETFYLLGRRSDNFDFCFEL